MQVWRVVKVSVDGQLIEGCIGEPVPHNVADRVVDEVVEAEDHLLAVKGEQ